MNYKIYFIILISNLFLSVISFNGVIIGNLSYLVYRSITRKSNK